MKVEFPILIIGNNFDGEKYEKTTNGSWNINRSIINSGIYLIFSVAK